MAAAASPRVSGLGFEVRLGLAGLGRWSSGHSRNCSSGELDIRDSISSRETLVLGMMHIMSITESLCSASSKIRIKIKMIDIWIFYYQKVTDNKQTVGIMRQDLDCVVLCTLL